MIDMNKEMIELERYFKKKEEKKALNRLKLKVRINLSNRVRQALKQNSKKSSTLRLIGCTINKLKKHLESKFTLGMNWKNYGFGWHIDHIKPCCKFDLRKKSHQKKCFHYTNLQPLWALENIRKSGK